MNDRYLFRAKRIDNGEWVEGYLIYGESDNQYRIIIRLEYSTGTFVETGFAPRVDMSTICQCTGLKDKNGKLIWENDILLGYLDDSYPEDATYAEVLWWRSGFYTRERGSNDVHEIDAFTEQNYEVIGNIFDNPELLEVRE